MGEEGNTGTRAETEEPGTREGAVRSSSPMPRWLLGALVSLAAITILWRLSTMSEWSWFQDDWVYMTEAVNAPFLDYVFQSYNGHLMPAQFALYWWWVSAAPLNYSYAMWCLMCLMAASLRFWLAAYRQLLGNSPLLLIQLIVLGLSPVFLPTALWSAAGLQTFSMQAAMGASVYFAVRWWDSAAVRHLVMLSTAFLVGLLFWQKAILIVIPVVGLLAFLSRVHSRPLLSRRVLLPTFLLAAISVAYLAFYLVLTVEDSVERPGVVDRTMQESFEFFRTGLTSSALPALFGGPWNAQDTLLAGSPAPTTWQQWLLLSVSVGAAVIAVLYRRHSQWLLATVAAYLAVAWGLVLFSSRYTYIGTFGILDARYVADSIPVLLLCGILMLTPVRGEAVQSAYRNPPPEALARHSRFISLALVGAMASSALYTNAMIWDRVYRTSPKPWVDNAVPSLVAAGTRSVFDSTAPNEVALSWAFPEQARISSLMKPLQLPTLYNAPAQEMLALDGGGVIRPAQIAKSIYSLPGPVEGCGYLIRPSETAFVPMNSGAYYWDWGMTVDYLTDSPGTLVVQTDAQRTEVPLQPGLGTMQAVVVDEVSALLLSSTPGSGPICVSEIAFGFVEPAGPS